MYFVDLYLFLSIFLIFDLQLSLRRSLFVDLFSRGLAAVPVVSALFTLSMPPVLPLLIYVRFSSWFNSCHFCALPRTFVLFTPRMSHPVLLLLLVVCIRLLCIPRVSLFLRSLLQVFACVASQLSNNLTYALTVCLLIGRLPCPSPLFISRIFVSIYKTVWNRKNEI